MQDLQRASRGRAAPREPREAAARSTAGEPDAPLQLGHSGCKTRPRKRRRVRSRPPLWARVTDRLESFLGITSRCATLRLPDFVGSECVWVCVCGAVSVWVSLGVSVGRGGGGGEGEGT